MVPVAAKIVFADSDLGPFRIADIDASEVVLGVQFGAGANPCQAFTHPAGLEPATLGSEAVPLSQKRLRIRALRFSYFTGIHVFFKGLVRV